MDPINDPIEVIVSEEGGNGTPPASPAPSQEPSTPEVPAEPAPVEVPPATPEEPAPTAETPTGELYELPDGRKVDGQTLTREWKENFLPDYTRKSQALAAKENPQTPLQEQTPKDPLSDPDYVPQSYAEIIQLARDSAIKEIEERQNREIQQRQAIETQVAEQLNEIKTAEPNLNENALFLHATKYGFRDLKLAHQNMKDMGMIAKTVQKQTADNIQKRNQDPIAANPGNSGGVRPDPSQFENSIEYLRSLK